MKFANISLLILALAMSSFKLSAQVIYHEDPGVTKLLKIFTDANKSSDKTVNGYRIQLAATEDRKQIDVFKKNFQLQFPQYALTTVYNDPYYKLRAGAFLTKSEAQNALDKVKVKYIKAYLAQDMIKTVEIVGED